MRGFEDFFSPLVPHPLNASISRSPWGGETKTSSDDGDDPNGSTSTPSTAPAEPPSQHPSQLPPQRPSELHPELAPASVSSIGSIPSPNHNLESNRDLRRRLLTGGSRGGQSGATARADEHEYPRRDRRDPSRRYPRRVYACRICACVAILAIFGIFLITRLVMLFKTGNAPLAPVEPADDRVRSAVFDVPGVVDDASPASTPSKGATPASSADLLKVGEDSHHSAPVDTVLASPLSIPSVPPASSPKPKTIEKYDGDFKEKPEEDVGELCWIFMHMEKSGGGGARQVATERWRKDSLVFDTVQWRRGDTFAADIMSSHWRLLHGGCVEALRNDGARQCKWVTIFRHPVARLLSAYDHCRNAPKDPLCPTAKSTDLATFAERWGNFAMRQFALADVSPSTVKRWANSSRVPAGSSVWYLVKEYLTRGGIAEDEVLEGMLERVQELLSTRYAAVGIAEDIDTTMALFDRALFMEGLDWSSSLAQVESETGEQDSEYDMRGSAAFRRAMANPRVTSALRLDMLLYEHAVNVFNEQVERYGVL